MTKYWLLLILFLATTVSGAQLYKSDNFETGASWNYSATWAWPTLGNNWSIVTTAPHSGTYCAQSHTPTGVQSAASEFDVTMPANENEIFVRFWFKAGANLDCDWSQFLRFQSADGSGIDLEVGPTGYLGGDAAIGAGCGHIQVTEGIGNIFGLGPGSKQDSGLGNPYVETTWTEYAFYINYSQNKMYFWKNASAYTTSDPGCHVMAVSSYGSWRIRYMILPQYYKSYWTPTVGQSELFWMDDIEIWTGGIPGIMAPPTTAVISAAVTDGTCGEGADKNCTVTFTCTETTAGDCTGKTFSWTYSGTAINGLHYHPAINSPQTFTGAGSGNAIPLGITIVDDQIYNPGETIQVTVPPGNYSVGTQAAPITIIDNDSPPSPGSGGMGGGQFSGTGSFR